MTKFFLLLFMLSYELFACATCSLMVPTVEVKVDLKTEHKRLTNINFIWKFSDVYTKELTSQYDKNKNNKLDKEELSTILKIKNNYLIQKDMLAKIKLLTPNEGVKTLKPKYENMDISIKDGVLLYTFNGVIDEKIEQDSKLSFAFEDNEGYFSFLVTDFSLDSKDIYHTQNLYLFTANILFSYEKPKEQTTLPVKTKEINTSSADAPEELLTQEGILQKSMDRIKNLFESIKDETNPLTYISLLFFAYMYGIIHALGPGHGKTLVASYFLTNDRSFTKALGVSVAIGFVHTFSAFLLTVAIYYFLDVMFAQFVDNAVYFTTKISALIIISIALYLLYKKHKAYKELKKQKLTFSTTPHPNTCGCGSCKVDKDSTDTALIISAGIIPCPGTITIFIFSLSLGLYYAGFLAALVMSIGMSTIIFFSSVISVFARKKTSSTDIRVKKALEYTSLFVILILGIFLLLG